ncbi:MAG: EF-P beta-lysylation protein EpmB [Gammaproteobacteria bacterium]|nr:EF-P beta-lysylation protein EpmB [Gammaproteobacteria bacterium]
MTDHNLNNSTLWQKALVNAITDPEELLTLLELDASLLSAAQSAAQLFPLKIPREFVSRIEKNNLNDPLLRQIMPLGEELLQVQGYKEDPLEEAKVNPIPGLLHKYVGRVLLTFIGTCAINCRYCFRRHFPYTENNPGRTGWERALNYISEDKSIHEVILSGGDPLVANDRTLQTFSDKLNLIPHIKRLRIHSRIPVILPERITPDFIAWLTQLKQKPVLVIHCNHPQEINALVKEAIFALSQAGITLLNQSVLLKGVNDNADTLVALSEALFEIGVQPYYLHALDKVQGTAHFDLEREIAQSLHWEMSQRLSGYLVPKLVYEQPGAPSKLSIEARDFYTG